MKQHIDAKLNKFPYIFIFFLEISGLGLSAFLGVSFYKSETKAITKEFKNDVNDKVAAIESEIRLNIEVLRSVKNIYDISENITPFQFHKITQNILLRHKDIQALEWVPKVLKHERQTYELQKSVNFEITERKKQGSIVRAEEREIYFPVYYLEPLTGNETILGFDFASSTKHLLALEKARDSGKLTAISNIKLAKYKKRKKVFLMILPVYKGESLTKKQRRKNVIGFVIGEFKIADIMDRSIKHTTAEGLNLSLVDITRNSVRDILYTHIVAENMVIPLKYSKKLTLIGGRKLIILATSTEYYVHARRSSLPYMIFLFGALFVSCLSVYSYFILRKTAIIENIVFQRTKELHEAKDKLEMLTLTDSLTGISNRRHFDMYLAQELQHAKRDHHVLSLIMIDIDYFKVFNDQYGHLEGDKCLKQIAVSIQNSFNHSGNLVTRYGGEEFAVILPNTHNVMQLVEECLQSIETLNILHVGSTISKHVTISAGINSIIPDADSTPQKLIAQADKSLYAAKEKGRNQVCEL